MDFYGFIQTNTDSKFIVLTRDNSVKAEVSDLLAQKYGRWHSREQITDKLRIELDPEYFFKRLEWRRVAKEFVIDIINTFEVDRYEMTYESLFHNEEKQLKALFSYLGINGEDVKSSDEQRSNPFSLAEMIVNYEEVKEY